MKLVKYQIIPDSADLEKLPDIESYIEVSSNNHWRHLEIKEVRKVIEETRHSRSPEEFRIFSIDISKG